MGIADKEECFLCGEDILPFEHRERDRHNRTFHPDCKDRLDDIMDLVKKTGRFPWEPPARD